MLTNRYRRILIFFARTIAGLAWWELALPRLGLRGRVERTRAERLRRAAVEYRTLALRLGGVLIKVGQFLSARLDVLPAVITEELASLQDEIPPERFEDMRRLAEAELGASLDERFETFDETPLAAASLGQVHRASLPPRMPGEPVQRVVVKLQRPNVEALIATDLAALRTVGDWLRRYPPIRRRADVPALLAEFSRVLYEEVDYLAEGRNAEAFAANFKDERGVRIPLVVWTHTTRRVLTLEDVYAIKITDYDAITAAGVDRAEVAERLFQTYLTQIFDHGFFHADPHPGNLFVQPLAPETGQAGGQESRAWQLVFVDFGMAGRVPPRLRVGLREIAIGVGTRNTGRLTQAYVDLGILLPGADLALLERAQAAVLERFWGQDMAALRQIDMAQMREFAREFRELLYAMPFQAPQDLILLGRTAAILSGICTGLHPHFNFWMGLRPFAERLMADEAGPALDAWLSQASGWLRTVAGLPDRLDKALLHLNRGELSIGMPRAEHQLDRLNTAIRRLTTAVVFGGLLLAGVQLLLGGLALPAEVLLGTAALALLWLLFSRPRA